MNRELLHALVRLENAMRLEDSEDKGFRLCECSRRVRLGPKCSRCLLDDFKKLLCECARATGT